PSHAVQTHSSHPEPPSKVSAHTQPFAQSASVAQGTSSGRHQAPATVQVSSTSSPPQSQSHGSPSGQPGQSQSTLSQTSCSTQTKPGVVQPVPGAQASGAKTQRFSVPGTQLSSTSPHSQGGHRWPGSQNGQAQSSASSQPVGTATQENEAGQSAALSHGVPTRTSSAAAGSASTSNIEKTRYRI